jgi:hypothetical protein
MLKTYSLSLAFAQSEFPLLTFKIFTAVHPEVSYHMHKLVQEQSWIAFPVPCLCPSFEALLAVYASPSW